MSIVSTLKEISAKSIKKLYGFDLSANDIQINETKPEFEGNYTIVLFSLVKQLRKSPEVLGEEIGKDICTNNTNIASSFNVIKGFLNITIADELLIEILLFNSTENLKKKSTSKVMIEYSSPNTNKPLHLGHLRNIFLGWSVAAIRKANGNDIVKTCIVNDRGVHICKSMIAWKMFANGSTPISTKTKGDHFVGEYYVKFNDVLKQQIEDLVAQGKTKEEAEKQAPIMLQTQQMLVDWENGKPEVMELWKEMNSWVYEGFDETYKKIGADFDKIYYESNTYLLGKEIVQKGLEKNVFYKKDDGSVWIDLTADGLDEKLVMRKDGTSVYITQDIGLAEQKYNEYQCDKSIYVIGDEQNYHMKVLKLICQKLELPSANEIEHLSYGMVELTTGKMKSREGTVVDADDIVSDMINIAKQRTLELGKVADFNEQELEHLYHIIGLGALKFFLLRVDPKKRMIFNPEESIDFHGFTGPFVQYTHARIKSVLRKVGDSSTSINTSNLLPLEKQLLIMAEQFKTVLHEAMQESDPSKMAIYVFNLAKTFNSFYAEHSIANAESEDKKMLRILISKLTADIIKESMKVLGIDVPERM
ncbi:MAG: arginine--tRNA ligase [Chitinophagaceae bacterium]|nr:arginine--tRNA ligase [Chitinophagaceae bacterium]